MTVQIVVNNVWSRIRNLNDIQVVDALDRETSFYVEGYQYTKAFREGYYDKKRGTFTHWDGKRHLVTNKLVFPTGLLTKVEKFLKRQKKEYEIIDQRSVPKKSRSLKIKHYTPRPYQQEAVDAAYKAGRGIIRVGTGGGKCLGKGTPVLKYNGEICNVEEIVKGDLLMGPDSAPRRVLSTTTGVGKLFKITPNRGSAWICNDVHILTLKHTTTNEIIDIPLNEYLHKSKKFKHLWKQFSVGVSFNTNDNLPIDPYFLGLWFGDGSKTKYANRLSKVAITNLDEPVQSYIQSFAKEHSSDVRVCSHGGRCPTLFIKTQRGRPNPLLEKLREVVGNNLEIPKSYITSSRKNRLRFLAGIIDSDGYLHNNSYEICQKRKDYAENIAFLARSLGFRALVSEKYNKQYNKIYFRISISGNVSDIPVILDRKKAQPRRQKKDVCKNGFSVEPIEDGTYFGFELDGDGRFLLGDFTVTHNTLIAAMIAAKYNLPTMVYVIGKDLLYQFHREMEKCLGMEVGIIGDGQCEVKKINVCSVWTAITAFNLKQAVSLDDEDWAPEVMAVGSKQKQEIRKAIESSNVAIYDEAHFLATDTIQSIFKAGKKCRFLFGLSGTDWRDDGADLLLESVCGERIYNMPASKLIEAGFLVPAHISFLEVPPYEEVLPKHYASVYSKYISNNDIRNGMIEDSARILMRKGRKVLILVRYLSHGRDLAERLSDIPLFFVNGEVDGKTREKVKKDFESGKLKCLIASSVFDIAVDLPSLDALILAGGGKSTVRALQRIGRVVRSRPDKKDAIVVDFVDNARYLDKHSATRVATYQTESKFRIKIPKGCGLAKSLKLPKKCRNEKM
jgi:superfamily II DNA or RNA helicase